MAHILLNGVVVGPDSSERAVTLGMAYVINQQRIPSRVQYAALGHVHNPKQPKSFELANAYYSGSLLQLDFGEEGQQKGVRLVDVAPGRKAKVTSVRLTSIRELRNIGTHKAGKTLDEIKALAGDVGDAYLKVFVKVDRPLPGLAEQVRELLPNAVDIVVERTDEKPTDDDRELQQLSAAELFTAYYRQMYAEAEPRAELMALFNRLHEEVTSAAD
jgi:exonuclease SbcD